MSVRETIHEPWANHSSPGARPGEEGFSMLEGLFAAALLLVVAVSVLPLFMRAIESNTRGGRSSQASTFVTAEFEEMNQASVDRDGWELTGATQNVRTFDRRFWDLGNLHSEGTPAEIGDEGWVDDRTAADGPILWTRDLELRKYSYADIHVTIDVGGVVLTSLGDPRLFDTPLATDTDGDVKNTHITEFRISLEQDRDGGSDPLVNVGQRMTVGQFRAY